MTDNCERWQNKEWYGKTKNPDGSNLPGEEGEQSSHVKWKNSQPQGKWKEIPAEIDAKL